MEIVQCNDRVMFKRIKQLHREEMYLMKDMRKCIECSHKIRYQSQIMQKIYSYPL